MGVFDFELIGWRLLDAELEESGDGSDCMWLGVSDSEPEPEERTGVDGSTVESLIVSSSSSSSLESIVMTSTFGRFGSDLSGAIESNEKWFENKKFIKNKTIEMTDRTGA